MIKAALLASLVGLLGSCNVNEYCLNCATGDGGHKDASTDGSGGDGGSGSGDGGACVPTGVEVCDNKDNDCNGQVDDNIAGVGDPCTNQMGECAGGKQRCVNGAMVCDKPPMPEICDNKDNNCNGVVDDGDPGGGGLCGTNAGECTAGTNHCISGAIVCQGAIGGSAEICNGRDDDCDGNFDESIASTVCGMSSVGACHLGTTICSGGGSTCVGSQDPTFEACDGIDNDCDGSTDEDYNLNTDPRNCGSCNHVCALPHATAGCALDSGTGTGACTIASCAAGYHNNNGTTADGCEYGPCQANGAEVCDGVDNDCDGAVDNGLTPPPGLCASAGACSGAVAVCSGAGGWKCQYGPNVSTDAMGNIIPETKCDTIDNDCDTKVDENQPNLNAACHDAGIGVCQGTGKFICDAANLNGPATCSITTPGSTATAEICDGKDNDCDGVIDNGAATGNLAGQAWVTIPGSAVQIMKYEASRPDANAAGQGLSAATTCSRTGVIPWTNVTYPQAVQACGAVGGRMCTETEWQQMCAVETYPITAPTGSTHLIIQAEDAQTFTGATSGGTARTWTLENFAGSTGHGDMQALPDTGAAVTAANAPTQSPRMDFTIDFGATPAAYYIWVRMYSTASSNDTVWTGINATAPGTATNATIVTPTNNEWNWVRSPQYTAISGIKVVSVFMREDGVRVDAISVTTEGTNPPGAQTTWAYASANHVSQPLVCNDNDYDTDAATPGDQDDIEPTGHEPNCYANGPGANDAFDMSGNVKEWTLARSPKQNPIRGGASNSTPDGVSCQLDFTLANDTFFFPNVGFRCCR